MPTVSQQVEYRLDLYTDRFNKALNSADFALRGFERSIGRSNPLLREMSVLFTGLGASVLVDKLFDAGDAMTSLNRRLSMMTNTINRAGRETLKQGEIFEFLYDTSNETGTALDVLTKSFDRILPAAVAGGIAFDDLKNTMKGVIGALSLSGATADEAARAFIAIGQVVGKDRLQMEELRGQLGEALPTAMLIVANGLTKMNRAMGETGDQAIVTIGKLNNMVQAGEINGARFLEALRLGTESYARIAAANITLVTSQYNRLSNVLQVGVGNFMNNSGIQTLFSATLSRINDTVEHYLDEMNKSADSFGKRFKEGLFAGLMGSARIIDEWTPFVTKVTTEVGEMLTLIKSGWDSLPNDIKEYGVILAVLGGPKIRAGLAVAMAGIGTVKAAMKDLEETGGKGTFAALKEWNAGFESIPTQVFDAVAPELSEVGANLNNALIQGMAKTAGLAAENAKSNALGILDAMDQALKDSPELAAMGSQLNMVDAQAMLDDLRQSQLDVAEAAKQVTGSSAQAAAKIELDRLAQKVAATERVVDLLNQERVATDLLREAVAAKAAADSRATVSQLETERAGTGATALVDMADDRAALLDIKNGIDTAAESSRAFVNGIDENITRYGALNREAQDAYAEINKATGLQTVFSDKESERLTDLIEGLDLLGPATGEAKKELATFWKGWREIDDAMRKISLDADKQAKDVFADQIKPNMKPEDLERVNQLMKEYAKRIGDEFFKEMFGQMPDAARIALADVGANRLATVDTVGKTQEQIDADIAARRSVLEKMAAVLSGSELQWDNHNQRVAELNQSAGQAQSDLNEKLLSEDMQRINKRIEAAQALYDAQESALEAYADLQERPELGAAKLEEEQRKGLAGPYSKATQGLDAVISADTDAKMRDLRIKMTEMKVVLAQLGDKEYQDKVRLAITTQELIDLDQRRIDLAFSKTDDGITGKMNAEKQAMEERLAAAQFEASLFDRGWYNEGQLDLARTAAETRLKAAQAEAVILGDSERKASAAAADLVVARNTLTTNQQAYELRATADAQATARKEALLALKNQELDLEIRLAALRDPEAVAADRRIANLTTQASLQQQINEWTAPVGDQIYSGLVAGADSGIAALSSGLTDVLTGVKSLDDAFKELAKNIIGGLIEAVIQFGIRWAVAEAAQLAGIATITTAHSAAEATKAAAVAAGQATQTAAVVTAGSSQAAALAPAAAMTSTISFGTAAVIGGAALLAMLATIAAVKSFHTGGVSQDEQMAKLQKGELIVPRTHAKQAYSMLSGAGVPFGNVGSMGAMGGGRQRQVKYRDVSSDFVSDDMVDNIGKSRQPTIINVFDMKEVDRHIARNPHAVVNAVQRDKRNRGASSRA